MAYTATNGGYMTAPTVPIADNVHIPSIGLGLWKNTDKREFIASVSAALDAGYRHFDTAQAYGNEAFLAEALQASSVPREEIFVTTKIAVQNFGYWHVLKSFENSLENLQVEYVDLLLLHFPVPMLRSKSWRALEEIHAAGKARAIGVSNYTIRHLKELLKDCAVRPAVNQVELHLFLQQPELVEFCKEQGIVVEAYSPLAHGHDIDDPLLAEIAQKYAKTPAQIMLRWCIEQGTVPLPKSIHADRIHENMNVFDFTLRKEDMAVLATLNRNHRTCWDPTNIP